MSRVKIVLSRAVWTKDQNQATATGVAPSTDTNGIEVPPHRGAEVGHLLLDKNCTATVKLYGQALIASTANKWILIDTVSFSDTEPEASLVRGAGTYQRVHASINAIGASGAVNAYWGFSE